MDYLQTIEANKTRFQRYNDIKYQRFQQLIPNPNVKRVINSIPFLLGTNDKRLPGYVEGDVPAGVGDTRSTTRPGDTSRGVFRP